MSVYTTQRGLNVGNLVKLAAYLLSLPEDYQHFGMGVYFSKPGGALGMTVTEQAGEINECGAVACAIGHGPSAGIAAKSELQERFWGIYCDENLIAEVGFKHEWNWCFSDAWEGIDDTAKGAGQRIIYMLDHGVPESFQGLPEYGDELIYREVTL